MNKPKIESKKQIQNDPTTGRFEFLGRLFFGVWNFISL
jgi:hypothetical protein